MPRFRVIVIATGMSIPPDGPEGFVTTRFVRATSEEDAQEQALALVAQSVAAEPGFASSPAPTLGIGFVSQVWSPFKRSQPNSGYCFYGIDSEIEDALYIERQAGAGWFL